MMPVFSICAMLVAMSDAKNYLLLFAIALLTHGLLFLHDGVHVDGWLFRTYIVEERWDLLADFFIKQGLPQTTYLYRFIGLFPNYILAHCLLAFGSLLAASWFTYALCRQTSLLSRYESLLVALFSFTFPAYQFAVEISHLWKLLPYALFLGGWLLVWRAEGELDGAKRPITVVWRVAGAFCLLLSFMNGRDGQRENISARHRLYA
jgi:hypothetical protein